MKYLLAAFAALCMALPVAAQSAARWGPADVWVTTPMGDSLQVLKQRYPKNQQATQDGAQTLEHSYTSKGQTFTVKTTRFDFNGHGAWESKGHWIDRHDKAIKEMYKLFPPDAPATLPGGGDAIGSIPGPEHVCPPGQSYTAEWVSDIPGFPGAQAVVRHHVEQAMLPTPESPAELLARFQEIQEAASVAWPPVP